jgi:hypothetical protein
MHVKLNAYQGLASCVKRKFSLIVAFRRFHAAKAEVIRAGRAGIDFALTACAHDVALTVCSLQRDEPPRCTGFFSLGPFRNEQLP